MEHHAPARSHTTPKDFFLWLGATLSLYGTVTAFLSLTFDYINIAFPDPLAFYGDLYGGSVRVSMATLIVLVPIMLGTLLTIRRDIVRTPGKANIWVRKWALVFTIFLASATAAITLITLLTTFLGGELSARFGLKALVVFLVAVLVALHFLTDLKGYWTLHRKKVNMVGAAVGVLAIMTVAAGFFIVGTPGEIRALREDQQRVSDLQNIQYQVTSYWQQKRALPASLGELNDPLMGFTVPVDPVTGAAYEYSASSTTAFTLCATFALESRDMSGKGGYTMNTYEASYPSPWGDMQAFEHAAGRSCFDRTIDPDKFPPASAATLKAL